MEDGLWDGEHVGISHSACPPPASLEKWCQRNRRDVAKREVKGEKEKIWKYSGNSKCGFKSGADREGGGVNERVWLRVASWLFYTLQSRILTSSLLPLTCPSVCFSTSLSLYFFFLFLFHSPSRSTLKADPDASGSPAGSWRTHAVLCSILQRQWNQRWTHTWMWSWRERENSRRRKEGGLELKLWLLLFFFPPLSHSLPLLLSSGDR